MSPEVTVLEKNEVQEIVGIRPEMIPDGLKISDQKNTALVEIKADDENIPPHIKFFREKLIQFFGEKFNLDELKNKPTLFLAPFAGYGHIIESIASLFGVIRIIGNIGISCIPGRLMKEKEKFPFKVKTDIHRMLQKEEFKYMNFIELLNNAPGIKNKIIAFFCIGPINFGLLVAKNLGKNSTQKDGIIDRIGSNQKASSFIFRTFLLIDSFFSELSFAKVVIDLERKFQFLNIITTHGATIRALEFFVYFKKILNKVLTHVTDPGFTDLSAFKKHQYAKAYGGLEPMTAFSTLAVPKIGQVKEILGSLIGKNHQIAETGTITDEISIEDFIKKWNSPIKNILIGTNGNFSNRDLVLRALRELAQADPQQLQNFRFHIFLGDQPDDICQEIFEVIFQMNPDLKKNIVIYRANNKFEAGIQKLYLQMICHLEILRPAGEQVLMGGAVGCVQIASNSTSPNENPNAIHAWQNLLANISRYPSGEFEKITGLNPANYEFDNFAEYLLELFSEKHGISIAKVFAKNAYFNIDTTAQLYFAMIGVAQNIDGSLTPERYAQIDEFMQKVRKERQEQKMAIFN